MLLQSVVKLGKYILADSFWMAQVAQIDITPVSNFEMVPVIGDQIVSLGNAEDIDKKFNRLYTFYQKAWLQNGINTYEKLDVQYDQQVVAIRKGAGKAWIDSARAREAVKNLLEKARMGIADSTMGTVKPIPVISKPVKDSVKTKTPVVTNNITNKKPLSKGKKSTTKKTKQTKAKAVMERKE
jgi:cell division protein FtsQ